MIPGCSTATAHPSPREWVKRKDKLYILRDVTITGEKKEVKKWTERCGQETLTLASLFQASDCLLETQRSGAAQLALDDLFCPHLPLPPSLPPALPSLCWLGLLPGHCAHSLPESIPSKLYEATPLLRGPQGAALRKSTPTRRLGGSGRLPLVSVLFFSDDPLHHPLPLPFLLQAENRFNCSSMFSLPESAIVQRQEPCWQLCGKPLIVSAHHRKLLMESNVGRKKGLKRTFTCVRWDVNAKENNLNGWNVSQKKSCLSDYKACSEWLIPLMGLRGITSQLCVELRNNQQSQSSPSFEKQLESGFFIFFKNIYNQGTLSNMKKILKRLKLDLQWLVCVYS